MEIDRRKKWEKQKEEALNLPLSLFSGL